MVLLFLFSQPFARLYCVQQPRNLVRFKAYYGLIMYGRLVDEGRGIVLYPFLPIKILIEGTKGGKLSRLGTLTIYLLVVAVISII